MSHSHLLAVAFVLRVLGQGLVASIFFPEPRRARIRPGTSIVFIRPNSTTLRTKVRGISLVKDAPDGRLVGIILPDDVRKEDLPLGTMMQPPKLHSTDGV
jgi:hypothetical protein